MLVLAIDTAGETLSAALLNDGAIRAEIFINTGLNHSHHLLPAIKNIYDVAGAKTEATDLFACTVGPGSFTGLRIAVSTIKGLAMATGKPVVGLSTLEALAANMGCVPMKICPMLDARKGQIYTALYKMEADLFLEQIASDRLAGLETFLSSLDEEKNICFLGSGAVKYADVIRKSLPGSIIAPVSYSYISAGLVGLLALKKFQEGKILDVLTFAPRYLRLSEAEKNLAKAENPKSKKC